MPQELSVPGIPGGFGDLELLRDAFVRGHLLNVLDLPWVLVYLALLYFIHPMMGFVSIGGVFLITLFQLLLRRIETKRYTGGRCHVPGRCRFCR